MKNFTTILAALFIVSCNANTNKNLPVDSAVVTTSNNIPAERKKVNPQPVKTYAETVKSFETTDEFKVRLYETSQTFNYLVKISYKQIEADDTLRVPNFGIEPAVEIVKGDSIHPSCIIGFFDKEKQFRKSKFIFFSNNKLHIKVLKHYAVYQSDGE